MKKDFAVIFDMDGVLIDSNPFHKIALRQFCGQHGHDLTETQLKQKIYGRTNREWLTNLFGPLPDEQINRYAEEKEQLFRELFANDIAPLKGLIPFLEVLERENIPRAIATSAPQGNVDFTFEKTEIGRFFKVVLTDRNITHSKPHPEIYLKTAEALGFPAERCIVFEDSLSGIEAALAASTKVVGVTTTHSPEEMTGAALAIANFSVLGLRNLADLFAR